MFPSVQKCQQNVWMPSLSCRVWNWYTDCDDERVPRWEAMPMQLSTLSSKILGRMFSGKIPKSSTPAVMTRECSAKRHLPHICQFFNMDKIFGSQILHPKTTENTQNATENKCIEKNTFFSIQSVKLCTWHEILRHCLWRLWQIWGMKRQCQLPMQLSSAIWGPFLSLGTIFIFNGLQKRLNCLATYLAMLNTLCQTILCERVWPH